eukprot:1155629-Pelagomonas_calceolata.AAC.4
MGDDTQFGLKRCADLVCAVGKVHHPDASRSFARAGAVQAAQHLDGLAACTQVDTLLVKYLCLWSCMQADKGAVQAALHLDDLAACKQVDKLLYLLVVLRTSGRRAVQVAQHLNGLAACIDTIEGRRTFFHIFTLPLHCGTGALQTMKHLCGVVACVINERERKSTCAVLLSA